MNATDDDPQERANRRAVPWWMKEPLTEAESQRLAERRRDRATRREQEVEVIFTSYVPREVDIDRSDRSCTERYTPSLPSFTNYVQRTTPLIDLVGRTKSMFDDTFHGMVRFVDQNENELDLHKAVETMAAWPAYPSGRGKSARWCGQRQLFVSIRLNEEGEQLLQSKLEFSSARRQTLLEAIRMVDVGRALQRRALVDALATRDLSEDLMAMIEQVVFGDALCAGSEWAARYIQSRVRRHFRTVHVRTLMGNTIDVQVDGRTATIWDVKRAIEDKNVAPTSHSRLIFKGKELRDEQTVVSVGYPLHVRRPRKAMPMHLCVAMGGPPQRKA